MAAPYQDESSTSTTYPRHKSGTDDRLTIVPSIQGREELLVSIMNIAARRSMVSKIPKPSIGPVLAIDSLRDPNFTTPLVATTVLEKFRAQVRDWVRDWDAADLNWESTNSRGRKCTNARIKHRRSNWYDGDDKQACKTCTEDGHVCGIARNGAIEILPLRGEDARALGPREVAYWMLDA